MTICQFQKRNAWLYLLPVALVVTVPAVFQKSTYTGDSLKPTFVVWIAAIAGMVWLLAKAFRVSVIHYPEPGVVQWQYRFFGAQYASQEVPISEVLAVGLSYWRTKYVYYEPVAALAKGKLVAIGGAESAYSLTGENDQGPFQAARRHAESVSKLLNVQCLASDPDITMKILGGQAIAAPNSRQSETNLNTWVVVLCLLGCLAALLVFSVRG